MILKLVPSQLRAVCYFSAVFFALQACGDRSQQKEPQQVSNSASTVLRFEQDLFSDSLMPGRRAEVLARKYGSFFDIFLWQLTRLGSRDSVLQEQNIQAFITDTNFLAVYAACNSKYADFSEYDRRLQAAFGRYAAEFPGKPVPKVLTTISVFSYPIICDSTHLAIALDMYLNPDNRFYPTLEPPLPAYLQRRMTKEYIVSDAMKGWLQSDFMPDELESDLLQRMIAAGRIQYALSVLLPEEPDSVRSGYSSIQSKWCSANEGIVWSFFIENKLLYVKDPNVMMKYVGEGPTTNGFPKESPGNIGQFIGLRMVQSYMKQHPELKLKDLMAIKDLHALFQESRYKPKRTN
jgi:hypothetical protein